MSELPSAGEHSAKGDGNASPQNGLPEKVRLQVDARFDEAWKREAKKTRQLIAGIGVALAALIVAAAIYGSWSGRRPGTQRTGSSPNTAPDTGGAVAPPTTLPNPGTGATVPTAERLRFDEMAQAAWRKVTDVASFDAAQSLVETRMKSDPTFVHIRLGYVSQTVAFLTSTGDTLENEDKIRRIDHTLQFVADAGGARDMDAGQRQNLETVTKQLVDLRADLVKKSHP